jgi:hypothetical protein
MATLDAAFSRFHLNTSNSPNVKVVQFVEAHNFNVEGHLQFEVESNEKTQSTLAGTIHQRHEKFQLGVQCMQNWLRKTP